jgi:tetratricopeptide (TPR) repeat protein
MQLFCKYTHCIDTTKLKNMNKIEILLSYLRATPTDSFLQHALALEYIKIGDDENAKKYFENVLSNNPNYVGTYYHLAKLLERNNEIDTAITIYKNGLAVAKKLDDKHSFNELQMALEDIEE